MGIIVGNHPVFCFQQNPPLLKKEGNIYFYKIHVVNEETPLLFKEGRRRRGG